MEKPLFLFDEDVDVNLSAVVQSRGYESRLMTDLKRSAPDPFVLETAEALKAILVTKNKTHFNNLSPRDDSKKGRKYRHTGVIYMGGDEDLHCSRFEDFIDLLCFEIERTKGLADPRLIAEIRSGVVRIVR